MMGNLHGALWFGTCEIPADVDSADAPLAPRLHRASATTATADAASSSTASSTAAAATSSTASSSTAASSTAAAATTASSAAAAAAASSAAALCAPLAPPSRPLPVRVSSMARLDLDATLSRLGLVPELATEDVVRA